MDGRRVGKDLMGNRQIRSRVVYYNSQYKVMIIGKEDKRVFFEKSWMEIELCLFKKLRMLGIIYHEV